MATELSQDLVIPAYTDTQLTVKKVEKGLPISELGCTKFAIDKFTFSSYKNVNDTSIEHSLGYLPQIVILYSSYKAMEYITIFEGYLTHSRFSGKYEGFFRSKDSSSAIYGTNMVIFGEGDKSYVKIKPDGYVVCYYGPGIEYTLITMA